MPLFLESYRLSILLSHFGYSFCVRKPLRPCGTPPLTSGGFGNRKNGFILKPLLQGEVARSAGGVLLRSFPTAYED